MTEFLFSPSFSAMLVRLVINIVVVGIIIDRLYYPKSKRRDFYFTFMLISIAIFFIVFFMIFVLEEMKGKTSLGIGIGLFGIFSIMRYRTDAMPVREMTYLFVIIALSLVNAISEGVPMIELGVTNLIFLVAVGLCEWHLKVLPSKIIQYDKIDLITPDKKQELIADLEKRLGLDIVQVEVGAVDFIRDMAMVKIRYRGKRVDGDIANELKALERSVEEFNK